MLNTIHLALKAILGVRAACTDTEHAKYKGPDFFLRQELKQDQFPQLFDKNVGMAWNTDLPLLDEDDKHQDIQHTPEYFQA